MGGLGTIGVADALTVFLAARFPNFYVYRTYLGFDAADAKSASNASKSARIAVVPETPSIDVPSRGRLSRQVVCRVVVLKELNASKPTETTFAPAAEVDPLVGTLDEIAELFSERVVLADGPNGATAELYVPEARHANDSPLYDGDELMGGRFLGAIRVAVFEKFERTVV